MRFRQLSDQQRGQLERHQKQTNKVIANGVST
jgi:hypothetical protein